ncbi:hypothetical protein PAEPH01_2903 [Pancytospora epiphaga]|nr:hypothetical protein PAEPH01_2903 [Pancytospora epiphaga]
MENTLEEAKVCNDTDISHSYSDDNNKSKFTNENNKDRIKRVKFNLFQNRVHMVPKQDKIIFDDIMEPICYEEEEPVKDDIQCPIEIVVESPAKICEQELTKRMSQFSIIKEMFDKGIACDDLPSKQINGVFPKLKENPFIVKDKDE